MIKSELIEKIALAHPGLYQRDVEMIVNVIFDEVISSMARGERVELRGFGAFSVKRRPARSGRNPRTGEQVMVDEKFVPYFKTGKELRQRMNKHSETKAKVKSVAKPDKAAATVVAVVPEKPAKAVKVAKPEALVKPEKAAKAAIAAKPEKAAKAAKPEKPAKAATTAKPKVKKKS